MNAPQEIDWQWAQRTGGNLSRTQRARLVVALTRAVPGLIASLGRRGVGRRGTARLDFASLKLPDSTLARDAEVYARETLSPHVLEHSYRTYLFGRVLATIDGASVDEEMTYVAALLHDLNLETATPDNCFAVVGAQRALEFTRARGASESHATAIGAAIAAHVTVGVDRDLNDPGGFISAGASVDVFGHRIDELDPVWVDELLQRHPRHDFKHHLIRAWRDEAEAVPAGRIKLLMQCAPIPLMIRISPFPE